MRRLIGPLFGFELVRLARRGAHARLRAALALLLLGALFVIYANWFPAADPLALLSGHEVRLPREQLARFAEAFFHAFILVQMAAVLMLVPVYVAGSIAEEKERRTLEFLLATDLGNGEIVLGKFFARLAHVAGILLTGVPVLALTQLWGGVDMGQILAGYAVLGATMLSLGGLSLHAALDTPDLRSALLRVYGVVLGLSVGAGCVTACSPFFAVGSPFVFLILLFRDFGGVRGPSAELLLLVYVLAHLVAAAVAVAWAVEQVRGPAAVADWRPRIAEPGPRLTAPQRRPAEGVGPPPPLLPAPPATEEPREPVLPAELAARWEVWRETQLTLAQYGLPRHPPVGDDPLLWKELHVRGRSVWASNQSFMSCLFAALMVVAALGGMLLLMWTVVTLERGQPLGGLYNPVVRGLGLCLLGAMLLAAGVQAAGAVGRERQNQTLDGLLTLPLPRTAILRAKWLGAAARAKPWVIALGVVCLLGLLTGGLHVFALALVALFTGVLLVAVVTLGIWLSVFCRTTMRANVSLAVVALVVSAGPFLLAELAEAVARAEAGTSSVVERYEEARHAGDYVRGLSPVRAWWTLAFYWEDFERNWPRVTAAQLMAAGTCAFLCLLAAGVLWLDARRRFETEGRA